MKPASQLARTVLSVLVGVISLLAFCVVESKAATPQKKVTITIAEFVDFRGPSYESKRALADEFERQHPNIQVKFVPYALDAAVITHIAAGDPPDLFWIGESLQSMAARGMLLDLTPYVRRDKWDLGQYFPILVDAYSYQGKLFGMPNDCAPIVQYYNADLLEKAGLELPDANWTWDKLAVAARKTTVSDKDGRVSRYGFGMSFGTHTLLPFIFQANGAILSPDGKSPAFDNPGTVEAFQFLERLMFETKAMMPGAEDARKPAYERFVAGDLPLLYQGAWMISTLLRPIKSFEWGISPLPVGRRKATVIAFGGYAIPANALHPNEAWEFLKFATSYEGQTFLVQTGFAAVPANRQAALEPNNYLKAFGVPGRQLPVGLIPAELNHAFLEFPVPEYQDLINAFYNLLPEWTSGRVGAAQFVQKVQEQWETVFAKSKRASS